MFYFDNFCIFVVFFIFYNGDLIVFFICDIDGGIIIIISVNCNVYVIFFIGFVFYFLGYIGYSFVKKSKRVNY